MPTKLLVKSANVREDIWSTITGLVAEKHSGMYLDIL